MQDRYCFQAPSCLASGQHLIGHDVIPDAVLDEPLV